MNFCFDEKPLCIVGAVLMFFVILILVASANEQEQWNKFEKEHNCVVVGMKNSQIINTFYSSGKVGVGSIPEQTAYKCDDGVTYWR